MNRIRMDKVYRETAKKFGVSTKEVKREMQAAIAEAYNSRESQGAAEAWNGIECKGEVPTLEEFFSFVLEKVNEKVSVDVLD